MRYEYLEEFVRTTVVSLEERTQASFSVARVDAGDTLRPREGENVAAELSGDLRGVVLLSFPAPTADSIALAAFGGPLEPGPGRDAFRGSVLVELTDLAIGRALDRLTQLGVGSRTSLAAAVDGSWRREGEKALTVELSSPGGGAFLSLALEVDPAFEAREAAPRPSRATVLLVDHSVFSRRKISQMLARDGYEVEDGAKGGAGALSVFARRPTDFVLVDLVELGVDEVGFVEKLVEIKKDVIIVVLTTLLSRQLTEALASHGVRDFLPKTMNESDLSARLLEATTHRYRVEIENEGQEAWLTIEPGRGRIGPPTAGEVYEALRRHAVRYGIEAAVVETALSDRRFGERILVARGIESSVGAPAQYELYFDPELALGRIVREPGAQERLFQEVRLVQKAGPGKPLVQKYAEPTRGTSGRSVTGRVVPGRPGKDPVVAGEGLIVSPDGKLLVATEPGSARFDDGRVRLEPLLEIDRSVTRAMGNIVFPGSVLVWGNVAGDVTITASGDVEVKGDIEGATLFAGRNVLVRGIVGAKERGAVHALGHVACRYIHNGLVESMEDVHVLGFASQVEMAAASSIHLIGEESHLCGGSVFAGDLIDVADVGSHRSHQTIAELASETYYAKIDDAFAKLRASFREPPGPRKKPLASEPALARRLEEVRSRIREMEGVLERVWRSGEGQAQMRVRGSAYPGSLVRIGKRFLDLERIHSKGRFYLRGMTVGFSAYSSSVREQG